MFQHYILLNYPKYLIAHCRSEMNKFSDEELNRFEFFMRSHFQRKAIKEIISPILFPNARVWYRENNTTQVRSNICSEHELDQM